MKRNYVIGAAAILLLSIATVDYYLNNGHQENQQAKYVGNNKANSLTKDANNVQNTQANPQNAGVPLYTPQKRETAYVNNKTHTKLNSITETPPESNAILRPLAGVHKRKDEVDVEAPKVYYANFGQDEPVYDRKPGHVSIGIEAGMNSGGFYQNTGSNTMANGFHAGALVNIYLNSHFALQPGLMYVEKGSTSGNATHAVGALDVATTNNYNLNYIELPLNVVFKLGNPANARFMVGGGPYVAYLASANTFVTTSSVDNNVNSNSDNPAYARTTATSEEGGLTNNFRKFDYGTGLFIGCELPKGFFAKASGELGFRNIQQNTEGGYNNRNYGFGVSIGQFIGR